MLRSETMLADGEADECRRVVEAPVGGFLPARRIGLKIDVDTEGDVVTLSGAVDSSAAVFSMYSAGSRSSRAASVILPSPQAPITVPGSSHQN